MISLFVSRSLQLSESKVVSCWSVRCNGSTLYPDFDPAVALCTGLATRRPYLHVVTVADVALHYGTEFA